MKTFKYSFAGILFSLITIACSGPQKPEIKRIENIKVVSFTNNMITVEANVILHNPNPISLELTGANIDVSVNDMDAAKVEELTKTKVEANSEGKIPLTVNFPPDKVLKLNNLGDLFNMVAKKKAKIAYKGELDVKVMGMTFKVPVEKEEEVALK